MTFEDFPFFMLTFHAYLHVTEFVNQMLHFVLVMNWAQKQMLFFFSLGKMFPIQSMKKP